MSDRVQRLEQLVEELREAQLKLEVAQAIGARGEIEKRERHLERLRAEHARASGWLVEGVS